jgi:hypothetical protein
MSTFRREHLQRLLYHDGPVVRFTQDTPVLPDVWMAYAERPGEQVELILTPYVDRANVDATCPRLAAYLRRNLSRLAQAWAPGFSRAPGCAARVAINENSVAVRLYLDELVRLVLPVSRWWRDRIARFVGDIANEVADPNVVTLLASVLARNNQGPMTRDDDDDVHGILSPDVLWMLRVIGTIGYAHEALDGATDEEQRELLFQGVWPPEEREPYRLAYYTRIVEAALRLFAGLSTDQLSDPSHGRVADQPLPVLVHHVSRNRKAELSIWRSRIAVKCDAVQRVFGLSCNDLAWAVVDDGIDASHPAFRRPRPDDAMQPWPASGWNECTRVIGTFDFTCFRQIISSTTEDDHALPAAIRERLEAEPELRMELQASLMSGRELDWSLIRPIIEVSPEQTYHPPRSLHGTHVAGILAGNWRRAAGGDGSWADDTLIQGICPDLKLYDLRVIDGNGQGDEFNVMAALQFVRYLNAQSHVMRVHGVNISLSIRHDVVNYACGRTPICNECTRLVGEGIVVVAAAGNEGYGQINSAMAMTAYQDISITDPGNAEAVITVGATHREEPHHYGVSYFSSRGPTGDGRSKPDLVAPGEKIESSIPGGLRRLDGTSMAAPHVSGAAALLMARHKELIGEPQRIKEILCRTATDLGRERYFQGAGMLDILRALQSI